MKIKTWILAVVLATTAIAQGATNDLTGLLQQGLFEEEANRNLDAAIANYQSLASAFDKDRQLAATAIFRLGECYRKLGKTNDAVVQYQRIVKEFSDQQTLVTLSQQNLAGLRPPSTPSNNSASLDNLRLELINAQKLVRSVDGTIETAHYTNRGPVLVHLFQDDKSMQFLADDQRALWERYIQLSTNHQDSEAKAIKEQFNAKQKAMEIRADELAAAAHAKKDALEKEYQQRLANGDSSPASPDEENNNSIAEAQVNLAALQAQLAQIENMSHDQLRIFVQQNYPNSVLTTYLQELDLAQQKLIELKADYTPDHPKYKSAQALVDDLNTKIDAQISATTQGLRNKLSIAQVQLRLLQARQQELSRTSGSGGSSGTSESATTTTDEERIQIQKIQVMIQRSPDLINAAGIGTGGETPLQQAATRGQIVVAKYLLDHGADVDKTAAIGGGDSGGSPLYLAAAYGHKVMVELLLSRGAHVNEGFSPLNVAVSKGFAGVVDVLLANKADVNAWSGNNGGKVLHTAVLGGNTNLIRLLIDHGADVNATDSYSNTPLHLAAAQNPSQNKLETARILQSAKAPLEARNKDGNTPLHDAAGFGNSEIVSLLLRSGATVDATNNQDSTPLFLAANAGRVEATRVLLAAKADPNHLSRHYTSPVPPVYPAIWNGPFNEILKMLLDSGANPEGVPLPQYGPLRYAIDKHNLDAVRLLLEHGANPNRLDIATFPLKQALIDEKNKPMVPLLLEKGADPNALDSNGFPPIFQTTDPDLARLLIDHKADVNARGRNGDTALMRAMGDNAVNLIKILAAAGAKTDLQDSNGNTALHFAVFNLKPEIVAALLEQKTNPNIQNNGGFTPLDLAKGGSNRDLMLSERSPTRRFALPANEFTIPTADRRLNNTSSLSDVEQKIADLLVNAGGLANLPKCDRIEIRRSSYGGIPFTKGSRNWNQVSLLESIAAAYGLLIQKTSGEWRVTTDTRQSSFNLNLRFPDFRKVVVYRRTTDSAKQTPMNVNVESILDSGDCSRDVGLEWGDIVEIPEADHPIDEQWPGLSDADTTSMSKCLARQVTVIIKRESTVLKLSPEFTPANKVPGDSMRTLVHTSFMLRSVLDNSKLVRVSSDLSRVKITRQDPLTKKTLEWTIDCTTPDEADLWLRDGDVIDVPEK
jgi:ankyrin repeat protein